MEACPSPELGSTRRRRRCEAPSGAPLGLPLELPGGAEAASARWAQAVLFAAAVGRASVEELQSALRCGADPGRVALGPCACDLAEAECVCLGYTPLHCACQAGSSSVVLALLAAAADPATRSGCVLFSLSPEEGEERRGAVIVDGLTPLHVAAACGHRRVVELLLRHRGDPHMGASRPRKTALGFAVSARQEQVVELLRRAATERVLERAAAEPSGGAEAFLARQAHGAVTTLGSLPQALAENSRILALARRVRARAAAAEPAPTSAASDGDPQASEAAVASAAAALAGK